MPKEITSQDIRVIAHVVRESITTRWRHPDWNYVYYSQFEDAVDRGIRMALEKAGVPNPPVLIGRPGTTGPTVQG